MNTRVCGLRNPYPVGVASQHQRDKKALKNNRHCYARSHGPTFVVTWMGLAFLTPFSSSLSTPQPVAISLAISPSFKSEGGEGEGKRKAQTPCMSISFSPLSKVTLGVGG